jgi:hypothetical protein
MAGEEAGSGRRAAAGLFLLATIICRRSCFFSFNGARVCLLVNFMVQPLWTSFQDIQFRFAFPGRRCGSDQNRWLTT